MIEVINHGVHYANGAMLDGSDAQQKAALAAAGLESKDRGGTIAYSILQSHNQSGSDSALQIRFDALISHDITYVGIIQTARASGLKQFPIPYALTMCSAFPQPKNTAVSMCRRTRLSSTSMPVK